MMWIASTAFGLEGVAAKELKKMHMANVTPLPVGGVRFDGSYADALRANLWLRSADRVSLEMARFSAGTFDELFEGARAVRWADVLPANARFPVRAHCARSMLMSPSDCQSIVKKAVATSLGRAYRRDWLPEDGANFQIDVSIHQDEVTLSLDSSGESLSRRGYRTWNGEAPLRETLAAALVLIAHKDGEPLYDPCCGTGTILCEAAMIETDRAPGLLRVFDLEQWGVPLDPAVRAEAEDRREAGAAREIDIAGSDIDPAAIELAKRHLHQAKIAGVKVEVRDLREVVRQSERGLFLTNPPYGERLGDRKSAQAVERALSGLRRAHPKWRFAAISADTAFERNIGSRAQKKRRLYNGRLECELMLWDAQMPNSGKND